MGPRDSDVIGHAEVPLYSSTWEVSLGYIARPCFKTLTPPNTTNQTRTNRKNKSKQTKTKFKNAKLG